MQANSLEVVWPLDNRDYLTVCDEHWIEYHTTIAWMAFHWGEDDEPIEDVQREALTKEWIGRAAKPGFRLRDMLIGRLSALVWEPLVVIAKRVESVDRNDMAIVAKSLLLLTQEGRAERVKVDGKWCYRVRSGEPPSVDAVRGRSDTPE